jgi:hypothetical protein
MQGWNILDNNQTYYLYYIEWHFPSFYIVPWYIRKVTFQYKYNNQSGANLDGKNINKHVRKKIMAI